MRIDLVGGSHVSQSLRANAAQTYNLLVEQVGGPGATVPAILVPTPGLVSFALSARAPIRALYALGGQAFAIIGAALVEVFAAGTLTERGTVANDDGRATISSSGDRGGQLFITAAGGRYVYDLVTHALTPVTGLSVQGGYLDGYFLSIDDTATFAISDLDDGLTWDPLQIAQRNDAADPWVSLLVVGKYVWLFGTETTSVFYDAGTFPFPFAPVPGALLNHGIGAIWSAVDLNGAAVWLAESKAGARTIVRAAGFGTPERISDHALDHALAGYATVADATAFGFQFDGHWLYVISFPTADHTWCFDATTGVWTELADWDTTMGQWHRACPATHAYAFDTHLVGHYAAGDIYRLSAAAFTEASGNALRRVRRVPLPRVTEDGAWLTLHDLEILMDVGMGTITGQGSDPVVSVRLSRDGGFTYGNERQIRAGAIGNYQTRVRDTRLGRVRDGMGVVELSWSEPVACRLISATVRAERGDA